MYVVVCLCAYMCVPALVAQNTNPKIPQDSKVHGVRLLRSGNSLPRNASIRSSHQCLDNDTTLLFFSFVIICHRAWRTSLKSWMWEVRWMRYISYLWYHDQAKCQSKENNINSIHPSEEDEVGRNRGSEMTCSERKTLRCMYQRATLTCACSFSNQVIRPLKGQKGSQTIISIIKPEVKFYFLCL